MILLQVMLRQRENHRHVLFDQALWHSILSHCLRRESELDVIDFFAQDKNE